MALPPKVSASICEANPVAYLYIILKFIGLFAGITVLYLSEVINSPPFFYFLSLSCPLCEKAFFCPPTRRFSLKASSWSGRGRRCLSQAMTRFTNGGSVGRWIDTGSGCISITRRRSRELSDDARPVFWRRFYPPPYFSFSICFGMVFGFLYLNAQKFGLIDDSTRQHLLSRTRIRVLVVFAAVLGLGGYTAFTVTCKSKPECNEVHSYLTFLPVIYDLHIFLRKKKLKKFFCWQIVSFIVLRNVFGPVRVRYSSFFAWFGRISLELFIGTCMPPRTRYLINNKWKYRFPRMGILSPNRSISHLACGRHARRLGSHSQLPRPQRDSNNIHIGLRRPRSAYHHGPVGGFSRTGRLEESPSKCHPLLLGSRAHRHPRRHVLNRKPSGLVSTTPHPLAKLILFPAHDTIFIYLYSHNRLRHL